MTIKNFAQLEAFWCVLAIVVMHSAQAQVAGVSVSISNADYTEPGFMRRAGNQSSAEVYAVIAQDRNVALRLEGRYAVGRFNYSSEKSGSYTSEPGTTSDLRAIAIFTLVISDVTLHPFAGYATRRLVSNSEGIVTSTGHSGYLRVSKYHYLPIGIEVAVGTHAKFQVEYDHFVQGLQESHTSFGIIENMQRQGYGFATSLMVSKGSWALGPFLQHWDIVASNSVVCFSGTQICREPANKTYELGFKISRTL